MFQSKRPRREQKITTCYKPLSSTKNNNGKEKLSESYIHQMNNLHVSKVEKGIGKKKPPQKADKKSAKSKDRNKHRAVSSYDAKADKIVRNSKERTTFLTPFENNKGRNRSDKQSRSQTRHRRKHNR